MGMELKDALAALDVKNDDQWTSDGLPRLDVLRDMVGHPVSRAEVTAISKEFSRTNPEALKAQPSSQQDTGEPQKGEPQFQESNPGHDGPENSGQGDPGDEDGDSNLSEEDQLRLELHEARVELQEAQDRHSKTRNRLDEIVAKREREQSKRSGAQQIKDFQKAQAAERNSDFARRQAVAKAMAEADRDFGSVKPRP